MAAILPTTAPTAGQASPVEREQRAVLPSRVDTIQWLRGIAVLLVVTVPWAPARMLFNPIGFEFALGIVAWLIWSYDWRRAWRPPLVAVGVLLLAAGLVSPVPVVIPANPLLVVANVHSFNRTLAWGLP